MALVTFVERAMHGRCAICNRRLPKNRIPLYHAHASRWQRGMKESEDGLVEVCVCGEKCFRRYNDDEVPG